MIRISKSILLTGLSVLALAACSGDKGPGELGSKEDIVVRNNGLPGSQKAAPPGEDFTSTVEQAQAIPAPEVAEAEPLPDNSPAMKEAVEQHQAANAPLASTPPSTTQANAGSAAPSETRPLDAMAPTEPMGTPTPPPAATVAATQPAPAIIPPTPQSAPSVTGNVYPDAAPAAAPAVVATQVPAPPAQAPAVAAATTSPGPSAVPANVKYPLDPNAPYSPKAVAEAAATAAATPPAAGTPSMTDSAIIKSAQTALKAKGAYTGAETGEIDANFLNALTIYQGKNGLAQGGLNEDTLRHLGLIQ